MLIRVVRGASCAGTVPDGDPIDTSTLGAKTFTVTGTDNATNETIVTHGYTVVDTIDPVVTIIQPDLATYELGATVFAMYTCADPGGSGIASCAGTVPDGDPIDTSTLGAKTFTVTGTDNATNETIVTHGYTVVDTTPPVIDPHADMGPFEGDTLGGRNVIYTSPATTDNVDPPGTAKCKPASGSLFPIGTTTVTCKATDKAGNKATPTTFTVTVQDKTAPVIDRHANVTAVAPSAEAVKVYYATPATSDVVDGPGTATCQPASGARFPIGTTTVTCKATDKAGNKATQTTFKVIVFDEADTDGDGVLDGVDNCPLKKNASQRDRDHDGIGNACDDDVDGDGVLNTVDNCPTKRNASQSDQDGDGVGDRCDPDRDGDLVLNSVDNCPAKENPAQWDRDGDGIGNKCDPDKDGDGVLNKDDDHPWNPNKS